MNVFEQQLIALAESLAEQLIKNLVAQLEAKLGLSLPIPPQATDCIMGYRPEKTNAA